MQRFYGKYLAFCRDINDPMMVGRIRAEVPYPLGRGEENWSVWALPCLPPGHFEVPEEGNGVWIEFAAGDINQPVWSGVWYKGKGAMSDAPLQEVHALLTDFEGNIVDPDREHTAALDPVSHAEHLEYHDHQTTFYTPHRRTWQSATGHALEWNDHPGKEGYASFADRFGRMLRLTARGLTRLVGYVIPQESGLWKDLNGASITASHSLTFADSYNDPVDSTPPGQWIELRDMAQAYLRLMSTPGQEHIELADFWGQKLRVSSKNGQEFLELVDKAGQKLKLDPVAGTVRIDDKNGNFILMADGKITISVPEGSRVNVGGEGGQQLATKAFVEQQYNTHTHISSAPGSPTSPPMSPSPLAPGNDITKKQYSE